MISHKLGKLYSAMRACECLEIAKALVQNGFSRTHSAKALGISRRTLLNKIKQYTLTRPVCRGLVGDILPADMPSDPDKAQA